MVRNMVTGFQEVLHQEHVSDREYDGHWSTSRSCGQRVTKHPETVGHTDIANARDYAENADAIYYRASERTSILWRSWVTWWTHKLSHPRRMWCTTHRKLARQPWRPYQQGSNTLLLETCNVCPSKQIMQDLGIRTQEERGMVKQDVGKQEELYLTLQVDNCK